MPTRAKSLRFKLALWFVLIFFLIQAFLLGGVIYFRREMVRRSLEDSLSMSARDMVDSVLSSGDDWSEETLAEEVPADASFVLFAIRQEDGTLLASSGIDDVEALPFSGWEVVPAGPLGSVFTRLGRNRSQRLTGTSRRLRLITLPFRQNEKLYFFQAATTDPTLERLLGPYADLVLIGMPVGLLAALLAAWIIAGRAVSPIHLLSEAARDVSPRSLGERIRITTRDEEVESLERELNSALSRIEEGYKAQEQFISNVSHELRTPVAVLLTQAQVAKMGDRTLDKGYQFVNQAETSLKRLGKIVESFLVLARSDLARTPPGGPVPIVDVVLGCLSSCRTVADQSGVRLIPRLGDSPAETGNWATLGDADLLQTMLENLVRNAISHSPPEGEVLIEVHATSELILLTVRDQGPGIPDDYVERIFDRFVQVPKEAERRDGTGLGLAIANAIARLHGGSISVKNNLDAGCAFTIELALCASELTEAELKGD